MATTNIFNVNTQACVVLVNKLEQLHRSALPLAVRGTLNDMAFDVKTRTLDASAKTSFLHHRSPTFFKRFSGVNRATGWNIEAMHADVGMTAEGGGASELAARMAVKNMEQQEEGGKIDTGLDYLKAARGGNNDNTVRGKRRWSGMGKLSNGNFTWKGKQALNGGTTKSRMINSMFMSAATGKVMLVKQGGRNLYILVDSIKKLKSGKFDIKSKLLYISRNDNNKAVTATHFSRRAAMTTVQRTNEFWIKNAQKQIDRIMKN